MIVSNLEWSKHIFELWNEILDTGEDGSIHDYYRDFEKALKKTQKWYAEKVIDRCCEEASCDWVREVGGKFMRVNKQSILKVKEEL